MAYKILVVDDEPDILMLVGIRLKANGYEVITAVNGEEALREARAQHPDLLVLDLRMPGEIDGAEVAHQLKADEATKNIPIILLTASCDRVNEKAKQCGADDYCIKPFEAPILLEKVKKLLTPIP